MGTLLGILRAELWGEGQHLDMQVHEMWARDVRRL